VPLVAVTQPVPVNPGGGFDYVVVDSERDRVYAAHPGGGGLLVADADTGNQIGQIIPVGPMAGLAIDPVSGHVFTGNGEARSVSEVDPDSQQIPTSGASTPMKTTGRVSSSLIRRRSNKSQSFRYRGTSPSTFKSIRRPMTSIRTSRPTARLPSSIRTRSR
jgi:hypothetical protein